jgi:sugar O-acyltransferase (sialic acid O-acetyltransferase NeuD family)
VHPTAIICDAQIGEGSYIGPYSIITTNIEIGNHAIINRGNQIGHDCRIGDFLSIMPNAIIGGNVTIGDCVYLGSCSNVREKTSIKDNVIIGMNAAVVKDISEPGTYVGVPAKQIK